MNTSTTLMLLILLKYNISLTVSNIQHVSQKPSIAYLTSIQSL